MAKWREIGEVSYAGHKYLLYLSNDNSHFMSAGRSQGHPSDRAIGRLVEDLWDYYNAEFYGLIKPIIDRALAGARDPSVSPNAR